MGSNDSGYDNFTAQYGIISSNANKRAFQQDSSYCLLSSLEVLDEEGNLERKADIFTKRTIRRAEPVTSVDTASEALALSIGEKAGVDLPYMTELTGKEEAEIIEELQGVIFKNPLTDRYETSDAYLSGNVREKLSVARQFAENNPEYAINVAYLEKVQPKELDASEIEVRLGATWVKPEYVQQFMGELFQTPWYLLGRDIQVRYAEINGQWNISGKTRDSYGNALVTSTYTEDISSFGEDKRTIFVIDTHPAVLDGFTGLFREELKNRGIELASEVDKEKPFIDHFYVIEDLEVSGPLKLEQYETLEEAVKAYFTLPNDKLKALGIQNTNPLPGSLDFIQCKNGIDTATMDYTMVEVWNNPEMQAVHAEIERVLALHDTEIAYDVGDRYFMIQTTADGFDYSFYDRDYHLLDGGILEGTEPGEPAKQIGEAVQEILQDAAISFEDATVVNVDDFLENVHSEEADRKLTIDTRQEHSEAEKLANDIDQFAYDYDYYDYMDAIDDRESSVDRLVADLNKGDVSGIREWLQGIVEESDVTEDIEKAKELIGRLDQLSTQHEPEITFFAAECMEFPVLGQYQEADTLQEAIKLYEAIPGDRMNGGKGIGFNLDDGSDYAGGYPLIQGGKVATDMIDLVPHYKDSPLVQQAVEEAKCYYPDARETEYQPREEQAPEPVVEQKSVGDSTVVDEQKQPETAEKRSVLVEKLQREQQTGSKRESVLKALRERQKQIKEEEKQLPGKQHDRKKEDHSL